VPESNPDFEEVFGNARDENRSTPDEEAWEFDPSEAVEFARLVPGTYHADIVERPEKKFSQNGNPMMVVRFFVTDQDFYGATPLRRFMLNGKGGSWTKEFLKAIGLTEEADGKKPIVPTSVVGRRCLIVTKWQTNQDGSVSDEWTEIVKCKPDPQGVFVGDSTLEAGV
jgi:hypothetical protein